MIDECALKSIEKLHEMKANGILSEEEFDEAKRQLLAGQASHSKTTPAPTSTLELPAEADYLAWALVPLKRYAQFTGRSSRKEFWLFLLGLNLICGALAIVWMADTNYFGQSGAIGTLAFALILIGLLAVLLPYVAVQVRRFHDQGRSGWFALLNLIPYIGAFIVLAFMAIEGTEGENQYGPDPKA